MSLVGFRARNHPQQPKRDHVDDRRVRREFFDPLHAEHEFTIGGRGDLSFRFAAAKNGQQKGIKNTADYEWQATDPPRPIPALPPTTSPTVDNARTA